MKKYIAIGHWEGNDNTTSVAAFNVNKKSFKQTLKSNCFIPYVIITEKRMTEIKELNGCELFNEVKKMTSNYRKWDEVTDYIEQCFDIMEENLKVAE